ncbi:uncharacterized protein LY79DRAFT_666086 [Colletotrichum navitas]|uniref:Uncharacterized protein n=1 Tax=Colletotrichum navitas TaxID=681940 RepID=A0AAD8Q960_9PEZI|nr:uncharacterized protein LY79DRAFT_666086 [Colletotrichum navitas]KAK1598328.1 hypothetical protein LY79DRAFT_666086 [Colletotrichum navitas]
MYPSSLLLLLASSVLAAQPALAEAGSQKRLGAFPDAKTPWPAGAAPIPSWHAARLNYSSPGPHLFASTYGLLQQWSNTVFPNGHTMAAVEIPAFTLFYHGRMDEKGPPSPEWLAFDLEMAYGIMGSTRQSFMLTYQTTRPVKALYFDGESATLMGLGQLDTQMLHLYGNVSGPGRGDGRWRGLEPEYERAMGLCDWLLERRLRGDGWGIEGVVRMNAGFEMIWCNFAGGSLRLVSKTNVTAPQTRKISGKSGGGSGGGDEEVPERSEQDRETAPTSAYPLPAQPTLTDRPVSPSRPPMPPNWRGIMGPVDREPFLQSQGWGWFSAATWHYGSNGDGAGQGETRARVLSCGIASWYSKDAWGSIVGEEKERLNLTGEGYWAGGQGGGGDEDRAVAMNELGRRRRLHHLEGATAAQAAGMRFETEVMLREAVAGGGGCSGMDWVRTMGEIVQRTAGQLTALEQGARFGGDWGNGTAVEEWLYRVRGQSHRFLVSFLEYPHEVDAGTWDTSGAVFGETYSLCRYRYTRLLVGVPLSTRERELRGAAEEVMGSICGVLLEVGFGIEGAWYDLEEGRRSGLEAKAAGWADAVRRLRAWVGWEGEFIRCGRVCGWDERCYIPMWPLVKSVWGGGGGGGRRPRPAPEYGLGGSRGGDHTGPGGGIPGRGRWWMGDETDLWEPKCVKMENVMPRRRGE